MTSRCDLHVHSKRSSRPSEWYLAQIGAPESFTEPLEVYRAAKARGMAFVTLADHDTVEGALELAHLPDTFLSCEVTAAFPEDGAEIHLLTWGISEADFAEIDRLRRDLYALRGYLRARALPHAVAHPMFRVGDRLTIDHLERLLLLFPTFERINGTRDPRGGELFHAVAEALDARILAALAERHGLEPEDPEPWRKRWVGGSDDHSGLYVATTWTETPPAATVAELLGHLRSGAVAPGGEAGSSLKLARSFQALAHDYYRRKVLAGSRWRNDPLADLLRRMAAGELAPAPEGGWARSLRTAAAFLPPLAPPRGSLALARRASRRRSIESALAREEERAVFEGSCRLGHRALARAAAAALAAFERGQPLGALAALPTLATGAVALSPYLAAFRFQHLDEPFHRALAERFGFAGLAARKSERVAWATDLLFEEGGGDTVRAAAALARRRGDPLVVVACAEPDGEAEFDLELFPPILERALPGAGPLSLRVPPVVEMIEFLERERFGELVVSTPGPVGLTALAAARLLGLPTTGLLDGELARELEALAGAVRSAGPRSKLVGWFYAQMDRVLVAPGAGRRALDGASVPPERLGDLPDDPERLLDALFARPVPAAARPPVPESELLAAV